MRMCTWTCIKSLASASLLAMTGSSFAGNSNCCVANGGQGCDDEGCQFTVCAVDLFCCNSAWDQICANEAATLCAVCGGGICGTSTNDCCAPGSGPGCNNADCCSTVCTANPFCCAIAWDTICADEAASLCSTLCGAGVENDDCATAFVANVGANAVTNVGATGSIDVGPDCEKGFGTIINNDVYYTYVATATGTTTVSTCSSVNFDSRLAAFEGPCNGLVLVGCNDDGPGCPGFTSQMTFEAVCGKSYTIVLGSFRVGATGSGTMAITQAGTGPNPCVTDLNGDGQTNAADLAILLGAWGPCP